MTLKELKSQIPKFGRDIAANLDSVLSEAGSPGLTRKQIWGAALACAFSTGSKDLISAVQAEGNFDDQTVNGCKTAASMMAMNNVYFRAMHMIGDAELGKLPPRLAMSSLGDPGVPNADFQIMCMAVSAIGGCGVCMTMKLADCRKLGIPDQGVQSALQIAGTIRAADCAMKIK